MVKLGAWEKVPTSITTYKQLHNVAVCNEKLFLITS